MAPELCYSWDGAADMTRRRFIAGTAGAAAIGLLPGCGGQTPAGQINFFTDWRAQAEHGGFYQALATGLYEAAGLTVTITPGGPQTDASRLLAANAIDLGMISNAFQVLNMAEKATGVKAVMASFQKDPQILMAHAGQGINRIEDIKGRPVYVADAAIGSYWLWLKARFGFADSQLRKYTSSIVPWLRDPTAVQEGYVSSEPFTARKAGAETQVFLLADAGYTGYAAMVGASPRALAEKTDQVAVFVRASRQGWADYLAGDGAPAHALIKRDNPDMTDELIAFSRAQMLRYAIVSSGAQGELPGAMTPERWAAFAAQVSALGVYGDTLDPSQAYTLDFLG